MRYVGLVPDTTGCYQLLLPSVAKIHPVFHSSLLKPYSEDHLFPYIPLHIVLADPMLPDNDNTFANRFTKLQYNDNCCMQLCVYSMRINNGAKLLQLELLNYICEVVNRTKGFKCIMKQLERLIFQVYPLYFKQKINIVEKKNHDISLEKLDYVLKYLVQIEETNAVTYSKQIPYSTSQPTMICLQFE